MNTILLITDADLANIYFLAIIGEIVIITNRVIVLSRIVSVTNCMYPNMKSIIRIAF